MTAAPGRRAFLRGATASAAAAAAAATGALAAAPPSTAASGRRLPCEGRHQAGITTPQQAAATFAAFDVIASDRAGLTALFRTLTDRVRALTAGGPVPATDLVSPPADSGLLGDALPADGLTVTVGVGASLFDERFGLAGRRPAGLTTMPVFPDDHVAGSAELHGDISLQICADSRDTVMHALRDITKHTRGAMQAVWKADGFLPPPRPDGAPRNQLGFKDGTSQPDVADPQVADALIWTGSAETGGSAWARDGSYQVIRIIRMLVEFWDRVSLQEQETMIGRRRDSGAPLDGTRESDPPDFAADPHGLITPLDSHIRLANPRTPAAASQRILRRGYSYDRGLDAVGDLDVGLVFCCYQQDVRRQFEAVQRRLAGEPLVDYVQPTGGGYFFALPGFGPGADHLAAGLMA
ncbi:iron uptake transporter deferrochelatase/peroxidase subunit [Streptomyces sp. ICBB 8177]|uniref:iron uptake transporter deferrochelatase/peroxidase subunit n=1 Tax=Streptomyces sp. ICBB 8177 TaxID=563922 RepID=UPI000D678F3B|nr:iron uptake transporter deferrochelatase/peroxidase subunit [Streptomyces sp. ICBB 8177]PWI41645.1 deferrochelatase/peroxidase EfeB [Streptomyces sp. ICBB 8177]